MREGQLLEKQEIDKMYELQTIHLMISFSLFLSYH
jgi:hypothetical protein